MDYIGIILLCVVGVLALIGFFVGLGKGFMQMNTWANEFLIAAIGASLIGIYAGDYLSVSGMEWLDTVAVLGGGIVIMLFVKFISFLFREGFAGGIWSHKQKLKYLQMEDFQESEQGIMDALAQKDYRKYNRMRLEAGTKFRKTRGGWGVWDRIFGAITGAIKYFTVTALIIVSVLIVLDVSGIAVDGEAITDVYLYSVYDSALWETMQPYFMDFILMGAVIASVRVGYKSGLFSALWTVLDIVLVILGFYLAYQIVFNSGSFDTMIQSLSSNVLEGYLGEGDMATMVAGIILTAGLGIIFAIVFIIIGIFVPKAIQAAREAAAFHFIDGILGAIVVFAIIIGILMFLFGMLATMDGMQSEPEIFVKISTYFQGGVSELFYSKNIFNIYGWMPIDLSEIFG